MNSAMGFLAEWAQARAKYLVIVSLILLFFPILFRKRSSHKPPLVHYWIPWVGSAFAMADPDKFFRRATERYGPVYAVRAFGKEFTHVTDPWLMSEVSRNAKKFHTREIRTAMAVKIFLLDPKFAYSSFISENVFPSHRKHLSSHEIQPLLRRYAYHGSRCLMGALDKFSGDGTSIPLTQFLFPISYEAAAYAYFGSSFPAKQSYAPFVKFDDSFTLMLAGLPRFFFKKNYQAWDEMIELFEGYLSRPHDDAIGFIPALEMDAKAAGFTNRDVAAFIAGDLWALETNAVMAIYWVLAYQLQRPEGLDCLVQEIDETRASWIANNPGAKFEENLYEFVSKSTLPLLVSTIQETLRLTTYVTAIRDVDESCEFGGYLLEKGEQILCQTRFVHLDGDIHKDPHSFVPDRYLKTKKFMKNGKHVANHSMPFGFGVSKCEGRKALCDGRIEDPYRFAANSLQDSARLEVG